MTTLRVMLSRILDVLFRHQRDTRLAEEVQTHLELLTADYIARGMSPHEARRAARRAFGGVEQIKDTYRDQRGLPVFDALAQDLRFAARLLRRDRSFTVTAVLVLGLGIGVNNMLFTILYAHTMRGLPIDRVDRIVYLSTFDDRTPDRGVSYLDFVDWRDAAHTLAAMSAFRNMPVVITESQRTPDRFEATFLSANAFSSLGVQPLAGHGFTPQDDARGAPAVAMLSAGAWRTRYGADPSVVGRPIMVDGTPTTIVGILRDHSGFPSEPQIWIPLAQIKNLFEQTRDVRTLGVIGRLQEYATVQQARAELDGIAARLAHEHPDTNKNVRARVIPINERYFGSLMHPAWLAFMTVGFVVVLISCANVANLLLARTGARAREVAIRASLGASRRRIIRQLLIEGGALATLGGIAGLLISIAGVRLFRSAIPGNALPYWLDYSVDGRTLASLVAVAIATVFAFALLPAFHATKTDVNVVLKESGGVANKRSGRRWTTAFLAVEFALAVILLGQLAVSVRSKAPEVRSDSVIDTRNLITAVITLSGDRYATAQQRDELYRTLRQNITALPAIDAAAFVNALPLMGGEEMAVDVEHQHRAEAEAPPRTLVVSISPGYFETLGLALVRGREFTDTDGTPGLPHVLVNERFVSEYLGSRDPLGQRIGLTAKAGPQPARTFVTIVGVAPSLRQRPFPNALPVVYVPMISKGLASTTLVVRSHSDSADVASMLRHEVARLDSSLPLYRIRTMADVVRGAAWNGRVSYWLLTTLTLIAVALSMAGLYAVASYGVSQETREFGLRMALGARPQQIVRLVLRRLGVQLSIGFGIGVICSRLWDWMFTTGRPNVTATDPESLLSVAATLIVLGAIACYVPVRRATRLDPVAAIRHE